MPPKKSPALKITPQEKELLLYLELGQRHGCPPDQIANFYAASIFLQPRQLEFCAACRECDKDDGPISIMYSGGRGSAKSHSFFAQIIADDCVRYPGLFGLLLRKVGSSNKEQLEEFLTKLFKGIKYRYQKQNGTVYLENGSKVRIGHFKDEKDIALYMGLEYDLIGIEEANQLSGTKIRNILSCLRTSKPNWRPRSYLDTNPGGVGHNENKRIYYDTWKVSEEIKKFGLENAARRRNIPSEQFNSMRQIGTRLVQTTVYDNKFVNKEYVDYLEGLTGWQLQAWLWGSWELMAGAFYTNWNELWHVFPNEHVRNVPARVRRWYGGYDYSFSHPACFTLCCDDFMGNTYIVDQFHENEMVIKEQVVEVKSLLKTGFQLEPWNLEYIAAGGDCFSRGKDGRTVAQDFSDEGIDLQDAQVDRINFNAVFLQRLGNVANGVQPTLYINARCRHLIEQIPILQHHETKTGDIAKMNANERGEGGDDAFESARNAIGFGSGHGCSFIETAKIGNFVALGQ